jgi:ubiquinone/menaquinone biosynthesis C-methylase UbiE
MLMSRTLGYRGAYRTQHTALRVALVGLQRMVRALKLDVETAPEPATLAAIQRRFAELLDKDLANVERGLYPASSLFQMPVAKYARLVPRLIAEVPRMVWRAKRGAFRDLPSDQDLSRYPDYFRRNFHWQTDGYLSARSAQLYDLSVEFLFLGAADVMRRQVMAPLAEYFARTPARPMRVLDVGCGSGATLRQLAHAWPEHQYHGIDLSPHYLREARSLLQHVPELSLVAQNAEHMPYRDEYFDAVVSVYLFHELPHDARRNVMAEMFRVLKPGGLLVIEDSAQLAEASEIATLLERFSREMHEPYYRSYVRDDLVPALQEQGFAVEQVEPCYVAKLVSASKPFASEA